jgi:pantothenate synthetase
MVTDLSMTVEIVGMPIVREPDGLAMSSRNVSLSAAERKSALALVNAIKAARALYASGERAVDALKQAALAVLERSRLRSITLIFVTAAVLSWCRPLMTTRCWPWRYVSAKQG